MKGSVMEKAGIACLMMVTLLVGCLAECLPQAFASELTAQDASTLTTQGFRTVTNPSAPKIDRCLASGAGKLAVHASVVNSAQGYEFQIAKNASFTKGVKKKKVAAYGTTFAGLKKGAKYYVRARAYQTSTNLCTKWSSKKSAKTGIAYKKSKITGTWKIVSSSNAATNENIQRAKAYNRYLKVSFSKSGKTTITGYYGEKKQSAAWVATSKTAGYEYGNYTKGGKITVSGNTLKLKYSNGVSYTCKK